MRTKGISGAGSSNSRKKATGKSNGTETLAEKLQGSQRAKANRKIEVLSSKLSYDGPLFQVFTDKIRENGRVASRDVIRHNGSAVILAIDDTRSKKDPLIVMERQYRHAAKGYLWEVPAGKLEDGEDALAGAKRELLEETGIRAKRWHKLVRYFASPGFLGEWMQVFVAQGLTASTAQPDYDEHIEIQLLPFSQVMRLIEQGKIRDGKTLISVMLYDRLRGSAGFVAAGKN